MVSEDIRQPGFSPHPVLGYVEVQVHVLDKGQGQGKGKGNGKGKGKGKGKGSRGLCRDMWSVVRSQFKKARRLEWSLYAS
jgi:hypothetical protein